MLSGLAAIIRFLGIMLSFVHIDIELILMILVLIAQLMLRVLSTVILMNL